MPKIRHPPCSSHFFCVEMWFFLKNICYFKNIPYLCTRKGLSARGRVTKLILWNETSGQLFGQSRKDVFETLLSVISNFATLNLDTAVMQQRRSRVGWFYIPAPDFPFIYIIRCALGGTAFAYMDIGKASGGSVYVYITWRGQALRCLSLDRGNAKAWTWG